MLSSVTALVCEELKDLIMHEPHIHVWGSSKNLREQTQANTITYAWEENAIVQGKNSLHTLY